MVLSFGVANSQVLQKNTAYGWNWLRGSFDSVLQIPKDTARGGKRIFETGKDTGQLRYMVGDSSVYVHTGRKWIKVGGSGGAGTPSFQDVLNVSRFLSSSQVISATDTFRINIAKNYWKLADSLLIFGMKRQDGAEHYIQMTPSGITTAVQNSSTSQAEQQFTFANGASKGTLRFRTMDLIYESPDSSNVNANNVLWVDMADGKKIKKGFISPGGPGVDTSSLSNRINLKLNISDTSSMLTNYRNAANTNASNIALKKNIADSGRANTNYVTGWALNKVRDSVQSNVTSKVNITDTAAMLSPYLRKVDTTVFARKEMPAFSIRANNTSAAANATNLTFRDVGVQTLPSDSWTATTAPTSLTSAQYTWSQIGKVVTLYFYIAYATPGSNCTGVTFALPSDLPSPLEIAGRGAANEYLYIGPGYIGTQATTQPAVMGRVGLQVNSGDTGWQINLSSTSVSARVAYGTIVYTAQ
jgi:hypothetical protein